MQPSNTNPDHDLLIRNYISGNAANQASKDKPSRVGKKLLAGVHLVKQDKSLLDSPNLLAFKRWCIVAFRNAGMGLTEEQIKDAKDHIAAYNAHQLSQEAPQNAKTANQFHHFVSLSEDDQLGESLYVKANYDEKIKTFNEFSALHDSIHEKTEELKKVIPPDCKKLLHSLDNLESINGKNFGEHKVNLEVLKLLSEHLENLTSVQKKTLTTFMQAHPDQGDYEQIIDLIKQHDWLRVLKVEDFKDPNLIPDPKNIDVNTKQFSDAASLGEVREWNNGMAAIAKSNPAFAALVEQKITAIMEEKGGKVNPALTSEADGLFRLFGLFGLMEDLNNDKLPGGKEGVDGFLKHLSDAYGKKDKQDFLVFLKEEITGKRKAQYNKLSEHIDDNFSGSAFKKDFKDYYVVQEGLKNDQFARGEVSIMDHPFIRAGDREKLGMVMQAKAVEKGAMTPELFNQTYGMLSSTQPNNRNRLYSEADSLINFCDRLRHPLGIISKAANEVMGADVEHNMLVDQLITAWVPELAKAGGSLQLLQEPLMDLMKKGEKIGSGDVKFGPHVIAAVLVKFTTEYESMTDVGLLKEKLESSGIDAYLLNKCHIEALKKGYQSEFKTAWKEGFIEGYGGNVPAMEIYKDLFSEHLFMGPVHAEKLKLLRNAAEEGIALGQRLDISPEIIAKGYINYFKEKGIKVNPSQETLLPYCENLPPVNGWDSELEVRLVEKGMDPKDISLIVAILKRHETAAAPKTQEEITVIVGLYTAAIRTLMKGEFSRSDKAKDAVVGACVALLEQQRKERVPLNIPVDEKIIQLYRLNLPELKDWAEELKKTKGGKEFNVLIEGLVQELQSHEVKGLVSLPEYREVQKYLECIKDVGKQGFIDQPTAAIAIRRLMQAQRVDGRALGPVSIETMRRYYFEAVIEKGLPPNVSEKTENIIALLSEMKGLEDISLTIKGQAKLQFLARQLASPGFAGGRSLDHFRVIRKAPEIISGVGFSHAKNLNENTLDNRTLGEFIDQLQTYVFKNQNLRELFESVEQSPLQAMSRIVQPAISVLGQKDAQIEADTKTIFEAMAKGKGETAIKSLIRQFSGVIQETAGVEYDVEISTEGILSSLMSVLREAKAEEINSRSNQTETGEISVIRNIFRGVMESFVAAQAERTGGMANSPLAGLLEGLPTGTFAGWLAKQALDKGPKIIKGILGNSVAAKLVRKGAEKAIKSELSRNLRQIDRQLAILEGQGATAIIGIELEGLYSKKKLSPEDYEHLKFLEIVDDLNPDQRKAIINELKVKQELFSNTLTVVPEIVDLGMQISLNILSNTDIRKHRELVDYVMHLAKRPEEPVDGNKLVDLLYHSAESVLEDTQKTFPGLFESIFDGMKSVTAVPDQKKSSAPARALAPEVVKVPTEAEVRQQMRRAGELRGALVNAFEKSWTDFDSDTEVKGLINQELIPKLRQEFMDINLKYDLSPDDIKGIVDLVKIGASLMNQKKGSSSYTGEEIAAACRRYCEDQLGAGKIRPAERDKEILLQYAFDGIVKKSASELISKGNGRMMPSGSEVESFLEDKVNLLISHQKIEGSEIALNSNGRAVIKEMITAMFDPEFASEQQLLTPLLLHRFPKILQGAGVADVSALNQADPRQIRQKMIAESKGYMGKINPLMIGKSITDNPQRSIEILSGPILDVLMEGSPVEIRQAKTAVSNLASAITGSVLGNQIQSSVKTQFGPIFSLGGIALEIDISTKQGIDGLRNNTMKLSDDLAKGRIPTTEEAQKYGVIAPRLVKFVNIVSEAQQQRSEEGLKDQIDSLEGVPEMVKTLDKLGSFFVQSLFSLGTVSLKNLDSILPYLKPGIAFGIKLFLESKIESLEMRRTRTVEEEDEYQWLKCNQFRTPEQDSQYKEFKVKTRSVADEDKLLIFKTCHANRKELLEIVSNVLIAFTKRHSLSEHEGLINYILDLADKPDKKVDEKELMGHVIKSADILLNQAESYEELLPGILGALTRLSAPQ